MEEITEQLGTAAGNSELSRVPLLSGLGGAALEELVRTTRWWRLRAGDVLFESGSPAGPLYVVHRGRLRVVTAEDRSTVTAELGAGETVGEIGLLTDAPRTATVVAVRDSVLLSIDRPQLEAVLPTNPSAALELATTIAVRSRASDRVPGPGQLRVVVLVGVNLDEDSTAGAGRTVELLAHELARRVSNTATMRISEVADPEVAIAETEQRSALTLVLLDEAVAGSDERHRTSSRSKFLGAAHQADLVLAVIDADRPLLVGSSTRDLIDDLTSRRAPPAIEVVVMHRADTVRPVGTPLLLDGLFFPGRRAGGAPLSNPYPVHHLDGTGAAIGRLARRLRGDRIGLVLSGGGARAMAHLGVVRTLVDAGLHIDMIGGTSMGALVAAAVGRSGAGPAVDDVDRVIRQLGEIMPRLALGRRFTLPVVSLLSVRKVRHAFHDMLGDDDLTDSWIPVFVVTGDLSRSCVAVVDRGPAALWTRASATAPGLWPAVVDPEGGLHVDGALFDNLPIVPMRARSVDRIIASNVSNRARFEVEPGSPQVESARAWLGQRVRRGPARTYPLLGKALGRTVVASSLAAQAAVSHLADATIVPAVDHIGLTDYRTFSDAVAAGSAAAHEWLEHGWAASGASAG